MSTPPTSVADLQAGRDAFARAARMQLSSALPAPMAHRIVSSSLNHWARTTHTA